MEAVEDAFHCPLDAVVDVIKWAHGMLWGRADELGYSWSYLACKIGHLVPILAAMHRACFGDEHQARQHGQASIPATLDAMSPVFCSGFLFFHCIRPRL
jgi:hypothetical protein